MCLSPYVLTPGSTQHPIKSHPSTYPFTDPTPGEILPSALFSGPNQLRIAARLSKFVWFLMLVLAPLSYPLAWLLDRFFGHHNPRKVVGLAKHTHKPHCIGPTYHQLNPKSNPSIATRQRYNRAELSALIEIHREVKRRNISIAASNPGTQGAGGGHHHQRSLSQTGATAARAGLLSLSHPGAMEDDEAAAKGGGGGLLRKLHSSTQQQQRRQGAIAGAGGVGGWGGMVTGNGAGDAMLSQVGKRWKREIVVALASASRRVCNTQPQPTARHQQTNKQTGRGGHRGGRAQDREQDGRRLHGAYLCTCVLTLSTDNPTRPNPPTQSDLLPPRKPHPGAVGARLLPLHGRRTGRAAAGGDHGLGLLAHPRLRR